MGKTINHYIYIDGTAELDAVGRFSLGVMKTKTLENEDLRPKTRLSFRDYEN